MVVPTPMLFFQLTLYLLSIGLPSCETTKMINGQMFQDITIPSSNLPIKGFCLFRSFPSGPEMCRVERSTSSLGFGRNSSTSLEERTQEGLWCEGELDVGESESHHQGIWKSHLYPLEFLWKLERIDGPATVPPQERNLWSGILETHPRATHSGRVSPK